MEPFTTLAAIVVPLDRANVDTDAIIPKQFMKSIRRTGFGDNLFTGKGNYDKDVTAGRVTAEFTPSQDLFIRLAGDFTQDDSNPKNGHRLIVGRTSGAPILPDVFDTRANLTKALGRDQVQTSDAVTDGIEGAFAPSI